MTNKLMLSNDCVLVEGSLRSIIIDPSRSIYHWIDNEFVVKLKKGQIDDNDFFSFMTENELLIEKDEGLTDIKLDYESPFLINNCLIDYNKDSKYNLISCLNKLIEIKCPHFQLRFFSRIRNVFLNNVIQLLSKSPTIISMELIIRYDDYITNELLVSIIKENPKVKTIIVHDYYKDEVFLAHDEHTRFEMGNIIYTKQVVDSEQHCGYIDREYFSFSDIKAITEAKHRNSCLNQKLSIDKDGELRNCPSLPSKYGRIEDLSTAEINTIILAKNFQNIWFITKDKIETCSDCEFRYICSDCRAYTINNDLYKKPINCNYDPYEKY